MVILQNHPMVSLAIPGTTGLSPPTAISPFPRNPSKTHRLHHSFPRHVGNYTNTPLSKACLARWRIAFCGIRTVAAGYIPKIGGFYSRPSTEATEKRTTKSHFFDGF